MQTETVQTPLSDSGSFSEFKERKNTASSTDVKTATAPEPKPTPSAQPDAPGSESATASEAVVSQETPGKEAPARGDAESRIRKLNAEKTRLEAENAEYRRQQEARAAERPLDNPKPPAAELAKPATEDPKPKREETLRKLALEDPNATYETLLDRYDDTVDAWRGRDEQRKAAAKQRADQQESWSKTLADVKAELPDLNEKLSLVLLKPAALEFTRALGADGLRALHKIGGDPVETARIAGLSPAAQIAAIAVHSHSTPEPPEKPQSTARPTLFVSRAPAPPRTLRGTSPATDPAATSYGQYKSQKRKQA